MEETKLLELTLGQIRQDRNRVFGKSDQGSDELVALDIFEEEIINQIQIIQDRDIAISLQESNSPLPSLENSLLSINLNSNPSSSISIYELPGYSVAQKPITEMIQLLTGNSYLTSSDPSSSDTSLNSKFDLELEPSSSISSSMEKCSICFTFQIQNDLQKAPCDHIYCSKCIRSTVLLGLTDRSYIPARCCKQLFPTAWIQSALTSTELTRYTEFQNEDQIAHSDEQIKNRELDHQYIETVTKLGWKICPRCKVGVERIDGCAHMTCNCKHEFCYHCLADFKPRKCSCDLFTELEMTQILNEVAPFAPARRREELREIYQRHNEHIHTWEKKWVFRKNKRCRNCPWICNQWYFQCSGCLQNQCGPCAFNRAR